MTGRQIVLVEMSPSGGLFQYAAQLGRALARRGEEVVLLTGPDPELDSGVPGFEIRPVLPTWHPTEGEDAPRAVRLARRGWRAARLVLAWVVLTVHLVRLRPGAVLFQHWRFTFEPAFAVAIARLLPGTRIGIVAHEPFPRSDARDTSTPRSGALLERTFGAAWRELDVAFVLGERTRSAVLDHWRPRCPVVVIPHGDEAALAGGTAPVRPAASTAPVALFFGTWTTYKGIDVLLDAWALVRDELPEARLVLAGAVGADVDRAALLARAQGIGGVSPRPGYVAVEDVPGTVGEARVVVTPYVRASQSGVAHLAYTFGRPVVGTTVGDLPEAIRDGVTGLLVPPSDPPALADAMVRLLLDPDLAQRLGDAGHDHVQQSWAVAAERVAAHLTERVPR
ncbi:glycosyltransferase family 4 protein [Nocardioides sp. YIM 152588]|uniref:glycosyltransferase family 4 protein n=1 Tax=Nocardioides sp. YIM 152588 TaxID=3158259 RepID=UPI0032E4EF8A